jgi:hypothetical protein
MLMFEEFASDVHPDADEWEAQREAREEANQSRDAERSEKFHQLQGLIELLGHDIADPVRRTQAYFSALDLVEELERWG